MADDAAFVAPNPDFAADLRRFVEPMPVVRFFGLRFAALEAGRVVLEMDYREELSFTSGFLQAGPIATLLDFAASFSCCTMVPAGWTCRALDLNVKYTGPTRGDRFVAEGKVLSAGKTISFAEATVRAIDGREATLCAAGTVTIRNVRLG